MKRFGKLLAIIMCAIMLFSVTSCGESNVVLPPHTHKYTYKVYPSSCSKYGYIEYNCACKDEYREDLTELAPHTYAAYYTIDKQPTYTSEGEKSYHCLNCNSRTGITSIPKLETDLPFVPTT